MSRFEDGRHDVDHMVELVPDAALVLDHVGQEIAMPWRTPPKCEAICLVQENGVSNAHAHGNRHVIVSVVRAPDIVEVFELLLDPRLAR